MLFLLIFFLFILGAGFVDEGAKYRSFVSRRLRYVGSDKGISRHHRMFELDGDVSHDRADSMKWLSYLFILAGITCFVIICILVSKFIGNSTSSLLIDFLAAAGFVAAACIGAKVGIVDCDQKIKKACKEYGERFPEINKK